MGGVFAVRLAVEHPERVSRLVLVATSGGVDVARMGGDTTGVPRIGTRCPTCRGGSWRIEQTSPTGWPRSGHGPLLTWSDADPVSPLSVAQLLAERIPDTRVVTVTGGTHAFANERPDETAAIIRSHLMKWAR